MKVNSFRPELKIRIMKIEIKNKLRIKVSDGDKSLTVESDTSVVLGLPFLSVVRR